MTHDADPTRPTVERRGASRFRLGLLAVTATLALLAGTTAPLTATAAPAAASAANGIAAWGRNPYGQATAPAEVTDAIAVAAGGDHSLALSGDGTVTAWGDNAYGQATVPEGLTDVTAIATGFRHSLALRSDGTVVAWGDNNYGQSTVPEGLTDVTAISTGAYHNLVLRSDGTITAWGFDDDGQATVPEGLTGITAVSGGFTHSLALHDDGTVTAWGADRAGKSTVPEGLSDVTAISGGGQVSLALHDDGTVTAWGDSVQAAVPAGLTDVTAVSAGFDHSIALRSDGTVAAWGVNGSGQATVPAALTGVTALSAGFRYNLAIGARPVFTADAPSATATVGVPYSSTFAASGAAATFELASGTLPAGLTLTPGGVLSGTPTAEGTSTFTIAARNAFGTTTGASHTVTVALAPAVPTLSGVVAAGVVGSAYDYRYTVTGTPVPTVMLTTGTLPPGLTLDPTGRLTGTPTTAGTFTFTVDASNSVGSAQATSTLTVSPQKAATPKADLRVDLSAPTTAVKGKTSVYTLITRNAGPATSTSVYSTVILPTNVQFVSATGTYTRVGNIVVFQRSALTNGQTVTEKITVTATSAGKATALATTFSARTPDPAIRSNTDTTTTTIR